MGEEREEGYLSDNFQDRFTHVPPSCIRAIGVHVNGTAERATRTFRTCGACGRSWPTADEFLDDPDLQVVGLQVAGHVPEVNLLIFQHACGSSVSVLTSRLRFLAPRPAKDAAGRDLFGSEQCRELCLRLEDWATCELDCINAPDRELLRAVLDRKQGDHP